MIPALIRSMVLFVTWQLFAKSCSNVVLPFAMVHVVAVEVLGSKLLSVREKLVEAGREVPREMGKKCSQCAKQSEKYDF